MVRSMVQLTDYIRIETSASDRIAAPVLRRLEAVMPRVIKLAEQGHFEKAAAVVAGVDYADIADEIVDDSDAITMLALTFGSMMAAGSKDIAYRKNPVPPVAEPVSQVYR